MGILDFYQSGCPAKIQSIVNWIFHPQTLCFMKKLSKIKAVKKVNLLKEQQLEKIKGGNQDENDSPALFGGDPPPFEEDK